MIRLRAPAGGGFAATRYVIREALRTRRPWEVYRRLRSRNTCKTCALGMGGQRGGMVNEAGHFPEFCKKSVQAITADMQPPIPAAFFQHTTLAQLAAMSSAELERQGRLAFPIIAEEGDTHYRRIGWDEALDRCGAAFRAAPPNEAFVYSSGRSSNEAAFLLQLVARAYGTANIHNCSYYCHQASGVALTQVMGSSTASVTLDDLAQADFALVIGANPASNHPRLITQLVHVRRRGGSVVVINPLRELGLVRFRIPSDWRSMLSADQVSDLYLQPHIGSDIALLKALLKGVVESGGVDEEFVAAHTNGWDAVRTDLDAAGWDGLIDACGVSRADINATVDQMLNAKRGVFLWAMGLTHHAHGVDNVLALANLALARGRLGAPGCGLLPIRGHSNVQGVGSMSMTPVAKEAFAAKLEARYGINIPREPGQDTYASMEAAADGRIQAALLLGGNLFASNPDRNWAAAALQRIPFTACISTKLNEGHAHGRGRTTVILPALTRDEESQPTTQESMFNYVRLSNGGTPSARGEMRSEVEIIASLAERILPAGRFDWAAQRSHQALRQAMADVVPGFGGLATIDETLREFQIDGRTFHTPTFPTANGRANFHVTPLPALALQADQFHLTTLRSEGQFNTVVYEEADRYRGNKRRDVVMIAQEEAHRLDLREGDAVRVVTEAGQMEVHVAIANLPPGNLAMYYPEANVLVPRRIDPRSKTPAFKSVLARLERVHG